ncbi:MAG TPA: hypothetical protein VEO56_03410 [Bacteroidota bacterium]|nr:hypothetical protein [Bacteroidota bacterium]
MKTMTNPDVPHGVPLLKNMGKPMHTRLVVLSALFLCCLTGRAQQNKTGSLSQLDFLIGNWVTPAKAEEARGMCSFSWDLQKRVIVRKSFAEYPQRGTQGPFRHDDLMIIYCDKDSLLRADYFDSEGHVISYEIEAARKGEVTFISGVKPRSPRYRLIYRASAGGAIEGQFDTASPESPESFATYLTWVMEREKPELRPRQ